MDRQGEELILFFLIFFFLTVRFFNFFLSFFLLTTERLRWLCLIVSLRGSGSVPVGIDGDTINAIRYDCTVRVVEGRGVGKGTD